MNAKQLIAASISATVLVAGIAVFAQNGAPPAKPAAPSAGSAHLWAEVGSFKLEGSGEVKVKFIGTLLIVKAANAPMPTVSITGNVRKEFENAEMGRTAWFGEGVATVRGSWRHLTVFGKKMDATWNGSGIAMVYGEFDSAGKTGFITVDGSEPFEWMSSGQSFYVPATADPRIQQQPGQGPRMPAPRSVDPGGVAPAPVPKIGS
ncbi:MAG: hypothetical protein M3R13_03115 [Armatimonadota bacterium]|nr:hypothetical protein [Armatimonadota bacterium]